MGILQGHCLDGYYSDYNFSDIIPVISLFRYIILSDFPSYIYIYNINILTYIDNYGFREVRYSLGLLEFIMSMFFNYSEYFLYSTRFFFQIKIFLYTKCFLFSVKVVFLPKKSFYCYKWYFFFNVKLIKSTYNIKISNNF